MLQECFIVIFLCVISCVLFLNARDTLFLPCDWHPLYSGVVREWENVIFRCTAHHVIVIICLHVFLHCSNFFSDLADLLHFVHSGIYLIWQASSFLRIISKLGNSLYLADFPRNHSSHSKAFFRARYSFILWVCLIDTVNTNQINKKTRLWLVYEKKLGTQVNHIESTCRAELSGGLLQGNC